MLQIGLAKLAAVKTFPKPAPRGEKVRELATSLERSLNFGSSTKKPAGGVSLHFQGTENDRSEPQRPAAQRSAFQQNDDDSDFSLSSDEDNVPARRKPDQARGGPQVSAVTRPLPRQNPVTEFKKPQTSQVTDFDDDFSDFDDDLDIEKIT